MPVASSSGAHSRRWLPTPWHWTPGSRRPRPRTPSPNLWWEPRREGQLSRTLPCRANQAHADTLVPCIESSQLGYLLRGHIERDCAEVDSLVALDARQDKKYTWNEQGSTEKKRRHSRDDTKAKKESSWRWQGTIIGSRKSSLSGQGKSTRGNSIIQMSFGQKQGETTADDAGWYWETFFWSTLHILNHRHFFVDTTDRKSSTPCTTYGKSPTHNGRLLQLLKVNHLHSLIDTVHTNVLASTALVKLV